MKINHTHSWHLDEINLHVVSDSKGSSDELIIFLALVILVIIMGSVTFFRSKNKKK